MSSHISALKTSRAHYFGEVKPNKCHGSSSAELSFTLSGIAFSILIQIPSCHLQPFQLQAEVTDIQFCSAPSVHTPVWNWWVIPSLAPVGGTSSRVITDLRKEKLLLSYPTSRREVRHTCLNFTDVLCICPLLFLQTISAQIAISLFLQVLWKGLCDPGGTTVFLQKWDILCNRESWVWR